MKDFTLDAFRLLLESIREGGYRFLPFCDFLSSAETADKMVVLRHDVDCRPEFAKMMATIEMELNVKASYYFRDIPQTFRKEIIYGISKQGHEIGYHYENLSKCAGNKQAAISDFSLSLSRFRELVDIQTISSHGNPISRFNNLALWEEFNYRDFGIKADVNLDVNYDEVLYLTETGRRWNSRYNRRDKVNSNRTFYFNTTMDLAKLFRENQLPSQVILNIHPQRWTDDKYVRAVDKITQTIRNTIKYYFFMPNADGKVRDL